MSRPKSKSPRKVALHVTITPDQMRWLKLVAKRQGIDLSLLVRNIITLSKEASGG
jgi:hypothetical protein